MSDRAQTPEAVAYDLMYKVLAAESRECYDREYLLSTYEECLQAVQGEYTTIKSRKLHTA
jgi:hypothetical protein